ncbi:MAG TPA: hypothetical protein VMU05_11640 [Dongiaceae bacterium]|nr:hypothetical protein [Dongiaceae bacterium]
MATADFPRAVPALFPQASLARAVTAAKTPAFLVTVDTECDNAWERRKTVTTRNSWFIPRFQSVCEQYGLRPTYFTTYEMAICPVFRQFGQRVLELGRGEIGMHLHAWDSPPIVPLTDDDSCYHPYLIEYPEAIMRQKIAYLTHLLEGVFRTKMKSHRAGRYGLNTQYAQMLVEHGYTSDCTVTPLNSWAAHLGDPQKRGGPDFTDFPLTPYFVDLKNIGQPGASGLLEIPISAVRFGQGIVGAFKRSLPQRSIPTRILNRAFPPRCLLSPHKRNLGLLVRATERLLEEGRSCVHLSIHSSYLMPHGSPMFPESSDVEDLYSALHKVFSFAARHFKGMTVTEFRNSFPEVRPVLAA